jgi:L-rhamnose mutarotase
VTVQRHAWVIRVRSEQVETYVRLHAAVWPAVLERLRASHIGNYSIFLRQLDDGGHYLFSYLEYTGEDFAADLAAMAADPETQRWWTLCRPCQQPLRDAAPGDWWSPMPEVFHLA